jgi:hypothetical protein
MFFAGLQLIKPLFAQHSLTRIHASPELGVGMRFFSWSQRPMKEGYQNLTDLSRSIAQQEASATVPILGLI